MAILSVARMGNPVLRLRAEPVPVEEIGTADFQRFCDDLLDSMHEHDGVGLAAPQVHVSRRVVVLQVDEEQGPLFLINPVVTPITEERSTAYEGCLSLPGLRGMVARWRAVRVDAYTRSGARVAFEAHEWGARVVQHECDHLDGVLYLDRAEPGSMCFLEEFRRHGPPVPSDEDDEDDDISDEISER